MSQVSADELDRALKPERIRQLRILQIALGAGVLILAGLGGALAVRPFHCLNIFSALIFFFVVIRTFPTRESLLGILSDNVS